MDEVAAEQLIVGTNGLDADGLQVGEGGIQTVESGQVGGTGFKPVGEEGWLEPVPPRTMGWSSRAKSGETSSAPVPAGPIRDLWPGTAKALSWKRSKSTGVSPAVWAASRAKGTP